MHTLHGQLRRRGREAKTEPLATYTSLSTLTFSELGFLFHQMPIISSQMTLKPTYPGTISEQITLTTPTFPFGCFIVTSDTLHSVLKLHFHLAPTLVVFPVSASGCTNARADSSCSFILINPYHVLLQISLTFSLLPAVGFLIQTPMNCNDFLTSFHSPT